ncbi:hypothetical protein P3S68_021868 [Capsicum galapagoense]
MVVKSLEISTSITMDKTRETIYKVLKNWHASDVNCDKIFEELNEMAHKSRDSLVLIDGRSTLQLTVKVKLFNHYVPMETNSNDMVTSTASGGNCLLAKMSLLVI